MAATIRRWSVAVGVVILAVGVAGPAVAAPEPAPSSSYSDAPFTLQTNRYTFGQAPVYLPGNRIVYNQDYGAGDGQQIYASDLNGHARACLTCGQPAPNGVPAPRPGGGWILYHSWQGHQITFGAPGMGGMGSELWIMRTDGTQRTQLTGLDPQATEGTDDYHAYWSPDGRHIVWAHLGGNFLYGGNQKWDIRVATVAFGPTPHLTDVRIVHRATGGWMETQWWAPNGKGFLYTETVGSTVNTELFYCRLTAAGCDSRRLTNNTAWDEQATFTPDMKNVIFMSSRDHPGFYNSVSQAFGTLGAPNGLDYLLILPIFEASYEQPIGQEATDLYELTLATGAVRRLSTDGDDGWIIPEFSWNASYTQLLFTECRFQDGERVPLPVDVERQIAQAQKLADTGALTNPNLSNVLAPLPIEFRTRIGTFDVG